MTPADAERLADIERRHSIDGDTEVAFLLKRLKRQAALLDEREAEVARLREVLQKATDKLCHYCTDYPESDTLSIVNESDRLLARGHYGDGRPTAPSPAIDHAVQSSREDALTEAAAARPISAETKEYVWRVAYDIDARTPEHTEAKLLSLVTDAVVRERELVFRSLITKGISK